MRKLNFIFILMCNMTFMSSCEENEIKVSPDYPFEVSENMDSSGIAGQPLTIEVVISNAFPYPAPDDLTFSASFNSNKGGHVEIDGQNYRSGENFSLLSDTNTFTYVPEEPGDHEFKISYINNKEDSVSKTYHFTVHDPFLSYVAPDGKDTGNCNDPEHPCATLMYAINRTASNDVIYIAEGTYTENVVLKKSVSLYGENQETTIIQASAQPDQEGSGRVISIEGDLEIRITNLTIRNGVASGEEPDYRGGGIYNHGASLDLSNVFLKDNKASYGGGIYNLEGTILLTDVSFTGNSVVKNGGGMLNLRGTAILTNVIFNNNIAEVYGGGMLNNNGPAVLDKVFFNDNAAINGGGGMYIKKSSPELTNITFTKNAAVAGGGIYNAENSSTMLTNAIFQGNEASWSGGGIRNDNSSPTLVNVLLQGNYSGINGGAMANYENSSPQIINVTFSGNSSKEQGGAVFNHNSSPALNNVIIWNNQANGNISSLSASISNEQGASPGIAYSLIANSGGSDNWIGDIGVDEGNNLNADPSFVNPVDPAQAPDTSGNLYIKQNSPAIDKGNPDIDLSVFPGNQESPQDLDGNPRVQNERIDIGAYEFQGNNF
ncbi:choice-of-anchor Q domain-containing protein [Sinomicrobium sp. M5D2P9]